MNLESKRRKLDEYKYEGTPILTPTSPTSRLSSPQSTQSSLSQDSPKIDGGYIHLQTFVKHNSIPTRLFSDNKDLSPKYSSFFGWMYILQMIKEHEVIKFHSENGIEENKIGNHSKMRASFVSIYRSLLYVVSLKKKYIISSIKLITDDLRIYNCLSGVDETVPVQLKSFAANLRQIIYSMKVQLSYSNTMTLVKPVILNEPEIESNDKENIQNVNLVNEEKDPPVKIKQFNPSNVYNNDFVDSIKLNTDNKCNIKAIPIEVKKEILNEIKKEEYSTKPNINGFLEGKYKPDELNLSSNKSNTSFNEKDLLSLDILQMEKYETIRHPLPFFVHIVTNTKQRFYQFCHIWKSVKRFSWSLYARSRLTYQDYQKFKLISPDDHYLFFNNHQIRSLSICFEKNRVFVIELYSDSIDKKDEIDERWKIVKSIMESDSSIKILHGMKTQLKLFLSHDIDVRHNLYDPKVGMWMINPDLYKEVTIDELSQIYMKNIIYPKNIDQFFHSIKIAHQSFNLMPYIEESLKANFQFDLFRSIEMKILPIIAKIEFYGIGFEEDAFNDIKSTISDKIDNIQQRACELAGRKFELSSPMEVSNVLFEELKLPYPEKQSFGKKPKVLKKSTKASILKAMCQMDNPHPLPQLILDFRKLKHILSVYIEQLPKYCFYYKPLNMTRILPIYNQTVVPTGRIACEHPNLQSIMRSVTLNLDEIDGKDIPSRDNSHLLEVNIRNAFIASEGMIFLSVDYCQLEFRLMTHFSQDPVALSNIHNKSIDIFKHLASVWLNKPYDSINDHDRSNVKSICYGLLYGMGETSLSESIGITIEEGKQLMKSFRQKFKGFDNFSNEVYEFCKSYGYIHTIDGRRRYIEGMNSSNKSEVAQAKRLAINSVCQGSASDIVKRAMIRVDEYFYNIKTSSRLVLNMHDELLYEVNENELNYIGREIKRLMETCIDMTIPLSVRLSVGKKWGSLKPWDIE